ncbi:FG-GAP and VCBS repeat-containing protein [Streptomyces tricolor]|uniref:FG-GAP and VCBS repeat-containing protein n=1 Tax=Streptomyces tricolor TaxID=68277 RepID=A0ABS9JAB0_9ACTN|nr:MULTISPECIES: FG-GAP and VCBS repeat-containing protein [Streptomyces]MCG0062494.1 FG-GAP and VCBS repeat-containing protein [Streptomyces tricolor]
MKHPLRGGTALAALFLAGLTPPVLSGTAAAAPSGLPGDFNGDGYRDVAVAAPAATVGGKSWAGQVAVVYGTASGPDPAKRQLISQNTAGVPGGAEKGDAFGSALAAADLNRDGYSDLVVGAPDEAAGSAADAGTVVIVWGSRSGLSGGTTVKNPQPLYGGYFGTSIAAADFTGDGKPDLAISAQSDSGSSSWRVRLIRGPFATSGTTGRVSAYTPGPDRPRLTAGRVSGDTKADLVVTGVQPNGEHLATAVYYKGTADGISKAASLRTAETAAIGDLDKDGYGDIVLGNPRERDADPSGSTGGKIHVVHGTSAGPSATRRVTLSENSAGVPDSAESQDAFGKALAVGDFDKDGYGDLAVGAPGETFGDDSRFLPSAGAITLLRGSASGLSTARPVFLTQDSPGVPGAVEGADNFGSALLASDVGRDGRADLTAVADGENDPEGALWHLPGAAGTLYSTTASTTFGPTKVGLPARTYTAFGTGLAG